MPRQQGILHGHCGLVGRLLEVAGRRAQFESHYLRQLRAKKAATTGIFFDGRLVVYGDTWPAK